MKIVLATLNVGKAKEIKAFFKNNDIIKNNIMNIDDVIVYSDLIKAFEIPETGNTFKDNAIIKANAVFKKLNDSNFDKNNYIVLADDSGINVPALGNVPGIFSARFAGVNATTSDNLIKLISLLKQKNISQTNAFYSAAIAISTIYGTFTTHGFMHGSVIDETRGTEGFGYDPMFIPNGYNKTLGELPKDIKEKISHRTKSLKLANLLMQSLLK